MFNIIHGREAFYKYYSVEGAMKTLKEKKFKWSSPSVFNDPYDCQFSVFSKGSNQEIMEILLEQLIEIALQTRGKEPAFFLPEVQQRFNLIKRRMRDSKSNGQVRHLRNKIRSIGNFYNGNSILSNLAKTLNNRRQDFSKEVKIFCVTETNDNLLMWSHYAQEHRGLVIKIKCLPEGDGSPLCAARKVQYKNSLPCITPDIIAPILLSPGRQEYYAKIEEIYLSWFLRKSMVWSYEKEWRVISYPLMSRRYDFYFCEFHPNEIEGIYLGAKMGNKLKTDFITLISEEYPKCHIYQAKLREYSPGLDFFAITD
ncbi:DUF2971 domain-containing protein [Aminobacterium sp. MB27-C1]|uniref:DUF2971 domain-containing protein n=1 Tax=Aminobacterium sp. MB27-C1 TaxID=3070661 RepID=UPI0027DC43BD|nr:DUF2971 domain-containing protein [Aminobacterium sp. MB27-C1]WMI72157.1 DUF2971 domain-containing protein [Aminobacterium sp. MB27-C1]